MKSDTSQMRQAFLNLESTVHDREDNIKKELFGLHDKIKITVLNPLHKLINEVITVTQRLENVEKYVDKNVGKVETEIGLMKLRLENLESIIDGLSIAQSTMKASVLPNQDESQNEKFGATDTLVEADLTTKLQDSE